MILNNIELDKSSLLIFLELDYFINWKLNQVISFRELEINNINWLFYYIDCRSDIFIKIDFKFLVKFLLKV